MGLGAPFRKVVKHSQQPHHFKLEQIIETAPLE